MTKLLDVKRTDTGEYLLTWPPRKGAPSWLKTYEVVSKLSSLKPKIRKEVQKLLDKQGSDLVECPPVKVVRGVTPHFWKENVSNYVVPRGSAPDDYQPPTITYRGSPEQFRDEVQKAHDSHPDPALRGKVNFTNT